MLSSTRFCLRGSSSLKKILNTRLLQTSASLQSNVAVVLSGAGVYDGSEVHEASAVWVHLSRAGADVSMFAPDVSQMHTIDHTQGSPTEESRNVLKESARIARGNVKPLTDLQASGFDAVIFPGGFGAAKNLSTFAVDGADMKVQADVERVLKEFHSAKKPIGLCCIAPVLAAKVISGCEVTMGSDQPEGDRWPFSGACGAVEGLGSKHVNKNVNEVHTDEANKIVTTPAYMCQTAVHEVFDGIGAMVKKVLTLIK